MDAFEIKWAKQIVGRLMFQEKVFENKVSISDSEMSEASDVYESLSDGEMSENQGNKKPFSYLSSVNTKDKNPGASKQERINAIQKFYKRNRM